MEQWKEVDYKNETVEELMEVLIKHRQVFFDKKSGAAWRSIVMTLGDRFPESRPAIHELFGTTGEKKKTGGGARLFSGKKNMGKVYKEEECDDCPKSPSQVRSNVKRKPMHTVRGKGENHHRNKKVTSTPIELLNEAEILLRFESNAMAMTAYCTSQSIDFGRATKAETLAKKIFEHFNSEEE